MGNQKRLLRQILGIRLIAGQAVGVSVHVTVVLAHQRVEIDLISAHGVACIARHARGSIGHIFLPSSDPQDVSIIPHFHKNFDSDLDLSRLFTHFAQIGPVFYDSGNITGPTGIKCL